MKRGFKNRKAQFYILAAIIVISVIVGMVVINNYAKPKKTATKIYDLGSELDIETGEVYNYGIYNKNLTQDLIANWTAEYYEYSQGTGELEDWIFVYGDENGITVLYFTTNTTGQICVGFGVGGVCTIVWGTYEGKKVIHPSEENKIEVDFKGIPYEFKIKKGEENFFFIISSAGSVASS